MLGTQNGIYGGSGLDDKRGAAAAGTAGTALAAGQANLDEKGELEALKGLAGGVLTFPGQVLGVLGTNANDDFAVLLNALEKKKKKKKTARIISFLNLLFSPLITLKEVFCW